MSTFDAIILARETVSVEISFLDLVRTLTKASGAVHSEVKLADGSLVIVHRDPGHHEYKIAHSYDGITWSQSSGLSALKVAHEIRKWSK